MQHPDEGTIHGWLDGAVTADEARALETHVASCAECGAAVAEARGIRAAATRILSALDDVPAGVIPVPDYVADVRAAQEASAASRRTMRPLWRRPSVRAAAALIAAAGLSWAVMRSDPAARDGASPAVVAETAAVDLSTTVDDSPTVRARVSEEVVAERAAAPAARTGPSTGAVSAAKTTPRTQAPAANRTSDAAPDALADRETRQLVAAEPRRVDSTMRLGSNVAAAAAPSAPPIVAGTRVAAEESAPRRSAAPQVDALPVPRIVIDRGYVDSVLAADSLETADAGPSPGRAPAAQARAIEPRFERRESSRPAGSPTTMRAQGCWLLETSAWSPRFRERDTLQLLPRRIELRLDRGFGDEASERLVRPAPGEPAFPLGTTGIWRVIASNQIRLTIATHERWTTVTMTVGDDSLSGTARAYSEVDRLLRRATVSARRVVCRTEP